jgi:hypothetical protein
MAEDKQKPSLTLVTPTAEGVATLFRKLTGKEPDMDKIRAELAKLPGHPEAKAAQP